MVDAEERGNLFVQKLLHRQIQRLSSLFNRLVVRGCPPPCLKFEYLMNENWLIIVSSPGRTN